MNSFQQYLTRCRTCGGHTSRQYAKQHQGLCKPCATGEPKEERQGLHVCPDCGERRLTTYQKQHHYHCDTCTRNVETTGGVYGY